MGGDFSPSGRKRGRWFLTIGSNSWEVICHHRVEEYKAAHTDITMSQITHTHDTCEAYEQGMPRIWVRYVSDMNASYYTSERALLNVWRSHVSHVNDSHHAYDDCAISHIWIWFELLLLLERAVWNPCLRSVCSNPCESGLTCFWPESNWGPTEVCPRYELVILHTWKRSLQHNQCVPFLYVCVYVRKECVLVHGESCNIFGNTITVYYWVMHATYCSVLQRTATCCSMLQCVGVYCWVLQTVRLFRNCLCISF